MFLLNEKFLSTVIIFLLFIVALLLWHRISITPMCFKYVGENIQLNLGKETFGKVIKASVGKNPNTCNLKVEWYTERNQKILMETTINLNDLRRLHEPYTKS